MTIVLVTRSPIRSGFVILLGRSGADVMQAFAAGSLEHVMVVVVVAGFGVVGIIGWIQDDGVDIEVVLGRVVDRLFREPVEVAAARIMELLLRPLVAIQILIKMLHDLGDVAEVLPVGDLQGSLILL